MTALLSQRDCARLLGLSVRTLERMRVSGTGPRYLKLGNSIRYRLEDIQAWLATRLVASTSEAAA